MSLENFLILSGVIFSIGLYGALTKKHVVTVLMCVELMFNAVNIAAVAMSRYIVPNSMAVDPAAIEAAVGLAILEGSELADTALSTLLTGQIFAVFVVTVAAAEIALGLAIVMAMYRNREIVDVTKVNLMRG